MNKVEIKEYLSQLPFAIETYPFDEVTCVYKVGGKMFALLSVHEPDRLSINLKNTPDANIMLRDIYEEIVEAYHMNKTHWIMLYCDRTLSTSVIHNLIDESYNIVYKSLTKKLKADLENKTI